MAKMKTEFELETANPTEIGPTGCKVKIIGQAPEHSSYVVINTAGNFDYFIKDKDLERFAVNILKALNSNKLKQ